MTYLFKLTFLVIFEFNFVNAQVVIKNILPKKVRNFPCMECHADIKSKEAEWPLAYPHHKMKFKHFQGDKKCYSCHNSQNVNELLLLNGEKVSYNDAYKVCTQCHGIKGREWKQGIHGYQKGHWNGKKIRYACRHCHKSHKPKFRKITADPAPRFPNLKRFFKTRGNYE